MSQGSVKHEHDDPIEFLNDPYCVPDAAQLQKTMLKTEFEVTKKKIIEKLGSRSIPPLPKNRHRDYPVMPRMLYGPIPPTVNFHKLELESSSYRDRELPMTPVEDILNCHQQTECVPEVTDEKPSDKKPIIVPEPKNAAVRPTELTLATTPVIESTKKQVPLYPLQTLAARKKARQERREERRKLKLKLEEENKKLAATLKELQTTLATLQSQICSSCFAQVQQYLYSHKDDAPDDYRFKLRKCSDSDCKGNDSANVQSMVQNLRI